VSDENLDQRLTLEGFAAPSSTVSDSRLTGWTTCGPSLLTPPGKWPSMPEPTPFLVEPHFAAESSRPNTDGTRNDDFDSTVAGVNGRSRDPRLWPVNLRG